MDRSWHIREYREEDEGKILDLRRAVFGEIDPVRVHPDAWYWQFRDNPAGRAVICLAVDGDRVVGQYAVIPTRFCIRGCETRFALSCDTMVHPSYQRQGMFVSLARQAYESLAKESNIRTVWGFPNENSLPGFTRKLGWQVVSVFPLRVKPMRPLQMIASFFPALKEKRKVAFRADRAFRTEPGLDIEPVTYFDESFDALWNRFKSRYPLIQIRDSRYLNWRYGAVPEFGYMAFAVRCRGALSGYLVLRMMDLGGHFFCAVADIFPFPVADYPTTRKLFRFIRYYCKANGGEFISCLVSQAVPAFLRNMGFFAIPERWNPRKWYFGCRYPEAEKHLLASPGNWYLTYGDTDIV